MKYFLSLILICTGVLASAEQPEPEQGRVLGTIEMWSEWQAKEANVDLEKLCVDVETAYNELNMPRGYRGKLLQAEPVRYLERPSGEKRFYCNLEVYKSLTASLSNIRTLVK